MEPIEVKEFRENIPSNSPREVPIVCPYSIGDIVLINFGSNDKPDIKPCKIIYIGCYFLQHMCEWIPKYRVQWLTKKGEFSKNWKHAWPAEIYRAYFDANGDKRKNPLWLS